MIAFTAGPNTEIIIGKLRMQSEILIQFLSCHGSLSISFETSFTSIRLGHGSR